MENRLRADLIENVREFVRELPASKSVPVPRGMTSRKEKVGQIMKSLSIRRKPASAKTTSFRFATFIYYYAFSLTLIAAVAVLSLPDPAAGSDAFRFDNQNEVLGKIRRYSVKNNESLYEIGRTYKTGFNEIVAANPGIDPYVPGKGTKLILPTSWILPDTSRATGIVINLSETRLYYFYKKHGRMNVKTYPIGIGDEGSDTPLGTFKVIEKIVHPAWFIPDSIRKEKPELPAVLPPGPDNPMGSHALRLSKRTMLIHGTDVPWGVGRRVSHGCIRLYPEDIVELFHLVPVNTKVTIVQQPVKVGVAHEKVYVAVYEDTELKAYDYRGKIKALLKKKHLYDRVDMKKLTAAVRKKRGFPVDVSIKK
jgi:L,D-transpeptidase ErfK/SrfK